MRGALTLSAVLTAVLGCDARISSSKQDAAPEPPAIDAALPPPMQLPWRDGTLADGLPPRSELVALPGAGEGPPVVTSNNPEVFTGNGLLYGQARPSPARGGASWPLTGTFGVYVHHINGSGTGKVVTILVTNPGTAPVTVSAHGSGYDQDETGGLGLGGSPDYRVSAEWIREAYDTVLPATSLAPAKALAVWQEDVANNREVDGRFSISASGPVYVYVVATSTSDVNDAVAVSQTDAPGVIATSGTPPPPFGREAGVYAHDTWRADVAALVPAAGTSGRRVGFMVNTATGGGLSQVQAFPALTHYADSAAEAVGMYGNVYDLSLRLSHDGEDEQPRRVRVTFASLATAPISRYWDGEALVDGAPLVIRHVPGQPSTVIADVVLAPDAPRDVRFRAMVPGLTSIPQALFLESY